MIQRLSSYENVDFHFGVENCKVFDSYHYFEFAPVTILTGTNSSGKSTLVNLISFVNDNFKNDIPYYLNLQGKHSEFLNRSMRDKALKLRFNIYDLLGSNEDDDEIKDVSAYIEFTYELKFEQGQGVEFLQLRGVKLFKGEKVAYAYEEYDSDFIGDAEIPGRGRINLEALVDILFHALLLEQGRLQNVIENLPKSTGDIFSEIKNREKAKIESYSRVLNSGAFFQLCHSDPVLDSAIDDHLRDQLLRMEIELRESVLNGNIQLNDDEGFLYDKIRGPRDFNPSVGGLPFNELKYLDGNLSFLNVFFKDRLTRLKNQLAHRVKDILGEYTVEYTELGSFMYNGFWELLEQLKDRNLNNYASILKVDVFKKNKERIYDLENSQSFFSKAVRKYHDFSRMPDRLDYDDKFLRFKEKWLNKFEIGKDLEVVPFEDAYAKLNVVDYDERKIDVSDLGFGVGQVVSLILLPLFFTHRNKMIQYFLGDNTNELVALEEPESNLHPNWQSLLMEMIFELHSEFNVNFIIETHSEYMIRKLQKLVADKKVKSRDFKIMYFKSNKQYALEQSKDKKKFYEIGIDENGLLTKPFGPGFFDEAGNLALDIIKNQPQFKN